jgi:hypothetical protein
MKRAFITLTMTFLSIACLLAQTPVVTGTPVVREGDFEFEKKYKATAYGLAMDLPGEADKIEALLIQRLEEESGGKVKSLKKDLMSLEATKVSQISPNTFDYYFRVVPASKKEKDRSTITFFIAAGNYNFIDTAKYPGGIAAARQWLANFPRWMRLKEIAQEEKAQQLKLEEATKVQTKLAEAQKEREEKANKLQAEIAELQEELTALQSKMAEQQTQLESQNEKVKEKRLFSCLCATG